jgi:hypothetical protein
VESQILVHEDTECADWDILGELLPNKETTCCTLFLFLSKRKDQSFDTWSLVLPGGSASEFEEKILEHVEGDCVVLWDTANPTVALSIVSVCGRRRREKGELGEGGDAVGQEGKKQRVASKWRDVEGEGDGGKYCWRGQRDY